MTKYHKLGGLNNKYLLSWQDWFLPRAVWEGPVQGLPPLLVDGHLLPVSIIVSPLHAFLSVSKFPLYRDISHIGLGSTLIMSF